MLLLLYGCWGAAVLFPCVLLPRCAVVEKLRLCFYKSSRSLYGQRRNAAQQTGEGGGPAEMPADDCWGRAGLLSCCRNTLLSCSEGAQPTDSSGECSRGAKGAPNSAAGTMDCPAVMGMCHRTWSVVPAGGSSPGTWWELLEKGAAARSWAAGSTWHLSWELRQSWPCLQELCCGQGTELPHERAMGELRSLVPLGRMSSRRSEGSSQRPCWGKRPNRVVELRRDS